MGLYCYSYISISPLLLPRVAAGGLGWSPGATIDLEQSSIKGRWGGGGYASTLLLAR